MLTNSFTVFAALFVGQAPTTDFHHDFRGGQPLPPELSLFGPNAEEVIKSEADGLRVTLPTSGAGGFGWGVALRFTFSGDFEVTGTYELLTVVPPVKSFGAGVALNALPRFAGDKFAKVGRFLLVGEQSVYVAQYFNKTRPQDNRTTSAPTSVRSGRLRLARKGSIMHYLTADAAGDDFVEIAAWEFGTEDLSMVRFIVNNNGSPTAVDARLLDLKVAGVRKPLAVEPVAVAVEEPKPGFPLALVLGLIAAALLIATGVRLIVRRRGAGGQGAGAKVG